MSRETISVYSDRGMTDVQWEHLMSSIWNIEQILEEMLKRMPQDADKECHSEEA